MASGDTLLEFHPYNNEPPSSNPASPATRNQHIVLAFDDAVDEEAVFSAVMPQAYGGNGITILIHSSAETAASGDVVWQTALERIGDEQQNVDSDSFAAFQSSSAVAVPGTSGLVGIISINHSNGAQMDSIIVGEKFRLKIRRDADDTSATDSVTDDMELHEVEIREQ